jgi:hypothetical protein
LDILILCALVFERQPGQLTARTIQQTSGEVVLVDAGSLDAALQRLEPSQDLPRTKKGRPSAPSCGRCPTGIRKTLQVRLSAAPAAPRPDQQVHLFEIRVAVEQQPQHNFAEKAVGARQQDFVLAEGLRGRRSNASVSLPL